jgi:hypothetical protein
MISQIKYSPNNRPEISLRKTFRPSQCPSPRLEVTDLSHGGSRPPISELLTVLKLLTIALVCQIASVAQQLSSNTSKSESKLERSFSFRYPSTLI